MKPTLLALYFVSSSSLKSTIFCPSTIIFPLVAVSNPPSKFNKVDFPAPDGPKITTNSPLSIFRLRLSKAFNSWSPLL